MNGLSLRARLALLSAAAILAVSIVLGWRIHQDAHAEIDRLFDEQLVQSARLLLAQAEDIDELEDQGKAMRAPHGRHGTAADTVMAFRVLDERGREVFRSAADFRPPAAPFAAAGFADVRIAGQEWRMYRLIDDDDELKVEVGQPHARRTALAGALAGRLTTPMLVALPLLLALVWWAAGRGLRPLDTIARDLRDRRADQLDLLSENVPAEVRPLVRALNALFRRVDDTLHRERRFTADAAHELRTPLAGIRANAQVAAAVADGEERKQALGRVIQGVDRATHLVSELLALARADAASALSEAARVDLLELAAEVVDELRPLAAAREVDLHDPAVSGEIPAVQGDEALLHAAIRNLIDNAVRHGGAGGEIAVRLAAEAGQLTLSVLDRGPGMPEELIDRAGERFFRVPGASADGAGLGLSLARRIAELHGGALTVANRQDGAGLQATIHLPSARP